MIQIDPAKAWSTPTPPDAAKYASSPSPATGVPDFAADFAAANAVAPGLERPMSMVAPLVWLIHRHTVPSSAIARAANVFAPGVKESRRPKFGLKSYIVWVSTTEAQGIDSGVGSSGAVDALGELDGESDGEGLDGVVPEGDEDGSAGCPAPMHPERETVVESATATSAVRMAYLRVGTASFSPPSRRHRGCNAAVGVFAAG
ncbi:MAG TPA: hypothetical protein VFN03_12020 [Trueperaceae bacterium]|nr:hypothetical protein [Trueperaceae bacterium]